MRCYELQALRNHDMLAETWKQAFQLVSERRIYAAAANGDVIAEPCSEAKSTE
jgi:hypothetical protein